MSKRRRVQHGAATEAEGVDLTEDDDPEPSIHATECTICCEKCVTSGDHRLASLACGHLFGQTCIERWVKQSKSCPVCSQPVKRNDVRVLFTDTVAVVDNSRQEEFNQKYLAEKAARTAMEMEVAKLKLQHAALQLECDKHKHRVMELLEENSALKAAGPPSRLRVPPQADDRAAWTYAKLASIPCSDARVCAISLRGDLLAVGTKFGPDSHGLLQVSLLDIQHRASIPLHRLAIRDVAVRSDSKYIATTAMDGKLHITSPSAQQSILHFDMPGRHGWSCCWDASNSHQIWVGHQNGTLSRFDMRKPGPDAAETLVHHFQQPVHAARSLMLDDTPVVVAATFSGVSIWGAADASQPLAHHMHMDIKHCCAMANNPRRPTQLVVSTRTTTATSTSSTTTTTPAQHFVMSLRRNPDDQLVETDADGVIQGHTTPSAITRSSIWSKFDSDEHGVVVGSGDVAAHEVKVWDVATSSVVRQFDAPQPVVDVQHGWVLPSTGGSPSAGYLAALTNDDLMLYKATPPKQSLSTLL